MRKIENLLPPSLASEEDFYLLNPEFHRQKRVFDFFSGHRCLRQKRRFYDTSSTLMSHPVLQRMDLASVNRDWKKKCFKNKSPFLRVVA
ncbi:hypothetical protein TNCV_3194261 [Trichonephila clavipes]|uniref:Uncharacterized protein n=1 Tax=Trichonephila clavipes TaxID=2585209 RepID=A0A8X6R8Y2_TRICX|nr:hypothetical protein TNCV_3194261 [Trichonephila clavipes]